MRDVILAAAGEAAAEINPAAARQAASEQGREIPNQIKEARSAGLAEGIRQGSVQERERIKTILIGESARGREALAQYFAFETDFSADVALGALSKSPAAKGSLDQAMANEVKPRLGPGGERSSAEPPRMISTEDIYARRRAAVAAASRQ
ncbi:hypothetical protein ACQR1K_10050 [Bradyrhizobium sp. HKCCYLRH3095]|uniref:hypothetical protein n=1 Tax=Bradyrhizobium sp. HKCCYLRH3095 TaxID=3420765 RepID=UPI003EBFE1CB